MKAQHTIQLNRVARNLVTVTWHTRDKEAIAGRDYVAASGSVTFEPGETSKTVEIEIIDRKDATIERTFEVAIDKPKDVSLGSSVAVCRIIPPAGTPGNPDQDDYKPDPGQPGLGPLIKNGLITNSFHNVLGRGGYFHEYSGTSEGQAVAIEGAFLAYDALAKNNRAEANWYLSLALQMCAALGDGGRRGPMLRQPFPSSVETITLLHWLFAARGPIPQQRTNYAYEADVTNGKLLVTDHAEEISRVWMIYPAASELLYQNPYSPAFDVANPAGETQVPITSWKLVGGKVEVPVPAGVTGRWKIVYSYGQAGTIKQGEAQEAWPFWTRLADGYAACAPDTFRWFDLAMDEAIRHDSRASYSTKWKALRDAMRRTAVRGQAISDLREVFKPMPGFPALPANGEPSGMFCYSDHRLAGPPPSGMNPGWTGYNFWSRETDGSLLASVPGAGAQNQVQIGRGFNDSWRQKTAYQDADKYLWVSLAVSQWRSGQKLYVYLSSTKAYSGATRWYADLTAMPGWAGAVTSFARGGVADFFVPIERFVRKDLDNAPLPPGTRLENFGISVESVAGYHLRVRNMRLVAEATEDGKRGSQMPYFPGAMPFAINADTINQQFVGWNGSPFHGYQLPDFWLVLENDADVVHPGLTVEDLPVANSSGGLVHPIQPKTAAGVTKPKAALLMEQQLLFLKHAQEKWKADAGFNGPFAHTFVLNTPARMSLGNPTPHTWVYTNDDPNTRWGGYQARVIESLTKGAWMARDKPGFADCAALSLDMALAWLAWIDGYWKDGMGPPTDFEDPRLKPVQSLYDEPHIAALVLRACVWLKLASPATAALCDRLIIRSWRYLEGLWVAEGFMANTWCPNPDTAEWFGFWHFEIITSICALLNYGARPNAVPEAQLRERLLLTRKWLETTGVK